MPFSFYWNYSFSKIKKSFKNYSFFYFYFLLLAWIETLSEFFISKEAETAGIVFQIVLTLFALVGMILFLNKIKNEFSDIQHLKIGDDENKLAYLIVPFLLYNIYYTFLAILGLILFFIPGILFYYAPLIATFGKASERPFKDSIVIAKMNLSTTIFLSVGTILLQLFPLIFKIIPNQHFRLMTECFFDIFDSFLGLVMLHMSMNVYFQYKKSKVLV